MPDNVHDVILVGDGVAGLFCALNPVTVLTPPSIGQDALSFWAQDGIAAAARSRPKRPTPATR
jgi:aspartate oxidase